MYNRRSYLKSKYREKLAMLKKKHLEANVNHSAENYKQIIESQDFECYFEHCYKIHDSEFMFIGPWWNPDTALVCKRCCAIYRDMLDQFERDGEIDWNWVMNHEKADIAVLADIAINIKDMLDAV